MPRPSAAPPFLHVHVPLLILFFVVAVTSASANDTNPIIPEPYPFLHSYDATALPSRPLSPDPLVQYRWNSGTNFTELQLYSSPPVRWVADPPSSFHISSAKEDEESIQVKVLDAGTLTLDFGVERAGWFEFDSFDLTDDVLSYVTCSLSEFNVPLQDKTKEPVKYVGNNDDGKASYRLETNEELYEGVRFVFITFQPPPNAKISSFTMTSLRVINQIRPVSYASSYQSHDDLLTKVWYTGAYGVRLNMHPHDFGTVLIERGDRVAIQGDLHPTIAAALAAFGGDDESGTSVYELIRNALNGTDSGCDGCHVVDDGIMSYPVLWAMSVMDYYWTTGDIAMFKHYVNDVRNILHKAALRFYPDTPNIVFMGWDDRLDDGWCGPCCNEAQLTYATLVLRAYNDFVMTLVASGREEWNKMATWYRALAEDHAAALTKESNWSDAYGLHAAANAINANLPTLDSALVEQLFEREFTDLISICSFAPFNQYWILQAMGNMGKIDHALASIRWCWGTMTDVTKGCFVENFDPRWQEQGIMEEGSKAPGPPSFCHPWSSGVVSWLNAYHVGIRPLVPGYEQTLISPFVSKLNPQVNGSVGTPRGTIEVGAKLDEATGEIVIQISTPVPTRVALKRQRDECILAGFKYDNDSVRTGIDRLLSAEEIDFVDSIGEMEASKLGFSKLLQPGTHSIRGIYNGCIGSSLRQSQVSILSDSKYAPFSPLSYPAFTDVDASTRGNWKGKFGEDGYVLFGFNNGADITSLPSYVKNITSYYMWGGGPHTPKSYFIGQSKDDLRFLEPPSGSDTKRALGSIGKEVSQGRGLVIDIPTSKMFSSDDSHRFKITLYVVANEPNNEFIIKAMDYNSRSNIAPLGVMKRYENGLYWSVEYWSGMRLRLIPRFGSVSLSALFFDSV